MFTAYVDGGLPGNGTRHNGNAMFGSYHLYDQAKQLVLKDERFRIPTTGSNSTNNLAEWKSLQALLINLSKIGLLKNKPVTIYMDSELVIKQFTGVYNINKPHLRKVYLEVKDLLGNYPENKVSLKWIPGTEMKKVLGH